MASMASLEAGYAHDIFVEWAADPKNLVLFTERGQVCLHSDWLILFQNLDCDQHFLMLTYSKTYRFHPFWGPRDTRLLEYLYNLLVRCMCNFAAPVSILLEWISSCHVFWIVIIYFVNGSSFSLLEIGFTVLCFAGKLPVSLINILIIFIQNFVFWGNWSCFCLYLQLHMLILMPSTWI